MIGKFRQSWDWFLGGLVEAALWCLERAYRRPSYRIDVGEDAGAIRSPDGTEVGRLLEGDAAGRFEPPSMGGRLVGAAIDLSVPVSWFFRRTLDPVALESVPFLDAFVCHQIERITPWRACDVHYRIVRTPVPGDPTRVGLEIGVVPKRLVQRWIAVLEPLHPTRLRIKPRGGTGGRDMAILIGQAEPRRLARARRVLSLALLGLTMGYVVGMGCLWWQTMVVRDEIEAQDRVMEERKAVALRVRHQNRPGEEIDAKLRDLRQAQARTVDVIEALAKALPDSAHLTDFDLQKNHLTLAGIASDMAPLVPALESSGRFADVAFGAATTKVDAGGGDRFHLEMRVLGRMAPPP